MTTKEYIVCLNRDVNYDQFWYEMEHATVNVPNIPDRSVEIFNNRDVSLRQCHYLLTDQEAATLRKDPRVYSVEVPHKFQPFAHGVQTGNFTKTTSDSGAYINWGLRRCISDTNPYGTGTAVLGDYTFALDGTGVDVVIQDSGLQVDHPEFQDADGLSRVQLIDWYAASGVTGTFNSAAHYQDTDGHGTHVAGIVAGKNYGWAKNAKVYSVKVSGLDGGEGGGLSDPDCFDVIIGWHNNKAVDPITGVKRPTIVNMSWGYGDYFENIFNGSYRGVGWVGTTKQSAYGMIGSPANRHGVRIASIDVSIQEMIDAGIHVCIAAGNYYQKIDVPGGIDYDNYYVGGRFNGQTPNYYHRGSSPHDDQAFIVGSLDSSVFDANNEYKSVFSECGPGVNIWAPGSDIMSSTSNTNAFSGQSYNFYVPPAISAINLNTGSNHVINSNGYVTFNSTLNTFSNFSQLGSSLTVGARDSAIRALYKKFENGGKSVRFRFEGNSIYSDSLTVTKWELTFWDNNWIELVVERHDNNQIGSDWAFRDADGIDVTGGAYALHFAADTSLQGAGAVAKSCVFTTTDGITWTFNANKSVSLVDGVYSLSNSVTTVQGVPVSPDFTWTGNFDDSSFTYNTPFSFIAFNGGAANPYKQCNISGTSMASPQVCGVGALYLQMEPGLTTAQLKDKITKTSKPGIYSTGLTNDYTNNRSIQGSTAKILYNPFNNAQNASVTGGVTIQNIGIQYR